MNLPLHPQYLTDSDGHRRAVLLPIDEYEALLADLADLSVIAERRDEPTIPHQAMLDELRRDGLPLD